MDNELSAKMGSVVSSTIGKKTTSYMAERKIKINQISNNLLIRIDIKENI